VAQHITPLEPVESWYVARVSIGLPLSADPRRRQGQRSILAGEAGKKQLAQSMKKPPVGLGKNGSRVFSWLLLV
jgi:hypothetical protein